MVTKKLLSFTTTLGQGGAERHLLRVLNVISSDLNVSVAVCQKGGDYEKLIERNITVEETAPRNTKSSTLRLILSLPRLCFLIQKHKPDVLWGVQTSANSILRVAWELCRRPCPLVLSVQNPVTREFVKQSMFSRVLSFVLSMIAYHGSVNVISLTNGVAKELVDKFRIPSNRIKVISNAGYSKKELALRSANPLPIKPSGFLLVTCGRLVPQKGHDLLLHALSRTPKHIHLWILGRGALKQELQELANSLSIGSRVSFLDFDPNPFDYYKTADLFVLSSRYEGFGNVIVEAMASGTAVLSTDCPFGPGEIIRHGVDGWLVPNEDVEALADGIMLLEKNSLLRHSLGRNATKSAEKYDASNIAQEHKSFFLKLASKI